MTGRSVPRWSRWVLWAILAAVLVVVLFEYVFPWVEATFYNPGVG